MCASAIRLCVFLSSFFKKAGCYRLNKCQLLNTCGQIPSCPLPGCLPPLYLSSLISSLLSPPPHHSIPPHSLARWDFGRQKVTATAFSRVHIGNRSLRIAPSLFFFAPIHALSYPRSHDNAYIIEALFFFVPPHPHHAVLPHPLLPLVFRWIHHMYYSFWSGVPGLMWYKEGQIFGLWPKTMKGRRLKAELASHCSWGRCYLVGSRFHWDSSS